METILLGGRDAEGKVLSLCPARAGDVLGCPGHRAGKSFGA